MKCTTATTTVDLPEIGGDVQVQLIPPKILREIRIKATKDGRVDLNELMVWKLVYGLKDPNFTAAQAREMTRLWSLRTLQPIVDRIDTLSGTDEHLPGVRDAPHSVRKLTEPMVMATVWLQRFPDVATRAARGPRARGAGRPAVRGASRRSSAKSGDSGSDGESSGPPPAGRPCECGCGLDISHRATQAHFLNDQHAAADRQRRKRERDRERDLRPRVPTTADEWRMRTFEHGEHEMLLRFATCRCNGSHILDEWDEKLGRRCLKCGRQMPESALGRVIHSLIGLKALVA